MSSLHIQILVKIVKYLQKLLNKDVLKQMDSLKSVYMLIFVVENIKFIHGNLSAF